jgi:hypothetical protein
MRKGDNQPEPGCDDEKTTAITQVPPRRRLNDYDRHVYRQDDMSQRVHHHISWRSGVFFFVVTLEVFSSVPM